MATNFYTQRNAFGTDPNFDPNTLPGAKSSFAAQPTFDPNRLPGQQPSPDAGNPQSYQKPDAAFTKPNLGGGGNYNPQGTDSGEAPLAGPGYQEDWYKKYGQDLMGTPSASEDLYSRGVAGSNPYYDFAQEQAIKAINDASAARGGFNSSYAQNLIGKTVADIRGQQAHELGMLAGQADQGKFGRYDRGNEYSGDAQRAMENRAKGGLDYEYKLSHDQASLVGEYYKAAGDAERQVLLAKIEASLKASGLTAAEAKQMADQLTAGASIVSKFYNPAGGGGSGGGSGITTPGSGSGGGGGNTWYV